jgi:retron-type reverse transcriptase
MRIAETILHIIHDRGTRGLPWYDVYRPLFNPDLYLRAYARLQQNAGATTSGATEETVTGMSQAQITQIIEAFRYDRWRWPPVRRVERPKSHRKTRPLGLPTWSDKLRQEVICAMLAAYYEPQVSDHSHGFRPRQGCPTALTKIHKTWSGPKWCIEGASRGGCDHRDQTILMTILRAHSHANRVLRLIEGLRKAGYCEAWTYHPTHSGTPQGGHESHAFQYLPRLARQVCHGNAHTRGDARQDPAGASRLSTPERVRDIFSEDVSARAGREAPTAIASLLKGSPP